MMSGEVRDDATTQFPGFFLGSVHCPKESPERHGPFPEREPDPLFPSCRVVSGEDQPGEKPERFLEIFGKDKPQILGGMSDPFRTLEPDCGYGADPIYPTL